MDSPARTNPTLLDRLLPMSAIFLDDIRQTVRHWAFITWGVLAVLAALIWFVSSHSSSEVAAGGEVREAVRTVTAAELSARVLGAHVLLWASFAIALGSSSIAAESDIAADAILCRGISRWQYYVSKCGSRVLMVAALFCLLTLPTLGLAALRLTNDLTLNTTMRAMGLSLAYLTSLTTIGVAISVWFYTPLVSVVVAWMALYGLGIVIAVLELGDLSPVGFSSRLPELLRGNAQAMADHHLLSVLFAGAIIASLISLVHFCLRDA